MNSFSFCYFSFEHSYRFLIFCLLFAAFLLIKSEKVLTMYAFIENSNQNKQNEIWTNFEKKRINRKCMQMTTMCIKFAKLYCIMIPVIKLSKNVFGCLWNRLEHFDKVWSVLGSLIFFLFFFETKLSGYKKEKVK